MQNIAEDFPEHRFETQLRVHAQIRENMILTLTTKHLTFIKKDNLSLHLI